MAPISNDLLLAAALTSAVPAVLAQPAPNAGVPRTGVATTVKAAPARTSTTMYIDGTTNQRLTTDATSTMHVLFSDQSAVTLGPNSEMTIAKYEFNPQAKQGQILLDLTKGLLRVVGGLISKNTATMVRTSTATIGIRGGISVIERQPNQVNATFLFGQGMAATDGNGNTQSVTRPGFGTNFGDGQPPSNPQRVSANDLSRQLTQLNTPPSGNPGGNTQPGGAPPGQLLSTGNTLSDPNNPAGGLSPDRLDTNSSRLNVGDSQRSGGSPQTVNDNTLRNILGTSNQNAS
ncbi:MAG: FecR domain-containing protein [Pseudomonadota bacterium]